ncbi:epididymal secretory protein E1-like [Limulus polyphemus]|uniref:Epididymal secretory protein E1-like n=1 Tax=Limulus polyphemus TaxID=6850 RepID=A0ABM1BJE6_LIMPO|nr:epididymal secretory protein E1-like [Limulus polyphemus]
MNKIILTVFLQLAILSLLFRDALGGTFILKDIRPCENGDISQIKEVRVTPCDKEPCKIPKRSSVLMEVDFIANQNSTKPKLSIEAKITDVYLPFPNLKPDGCNGKNLQCPLLKGKSYTFQYNLEVLPYYPTITALAKWNLTGDDEKDIFCFLAPVSIEPAQS